jgi:predicted metal-dependent enzyme (double-stranded beta helix superfamily)
LTTSRASAATHARSSTARRASRCSRCAFPNGRRTPPHDHGAWAQILVLSGAEKNTLYRRDNGALRKAGEVTLARGSILPMRADTVHVAECLGDTPAIGLHVYGGDILELPRRMWNPETLEEHPLEWGTVRKLRPHRVECGGRARALNR